MKSSAVKRAAAITLAVGFGLALAARAETPPLVFVDMERAFTEFYKTKLADEQLKKQAEEFNEERKKLTEEFEKLQEQFNLLRDEAQNTALSEDARAQKRNAAEEKLIETRDMETRIRRFDEARQKQLDDQTRRMRKRIVDEIQQTIQTYARTQGLSTVLDSSGQSFNGVELVLYQDVRSDITDIILEQLNKTEGQAEPAAAPAAEETEK
ncbi:MAG TPA: OmpH family outer membrane protein [Kiritimatiellia bacterium]|nr:OmpH family outer membrane protein [Kiritimatiellia bacterium]HRZ13004.1 OmpH family outer membrane protein [Kiritimatiellia bacterium]HSA18386.1 OmpH family outer membrane protein [Kiritimatiellia bacterium]